MRNSANVGRLCGYLRFCKAENCDIPQKITIMGIGERIKEVAAKAGGQKILAEKIGISARAISDYIAGKSSPQIKTLELIAEASGADLTWLLLGNGSSDRVESRRSLVSSFDPDEGGAGWTSGSWKPAMKGALPEIDVRLGAGEGSVGEMVTIPSNGGFAGHKVVAEWVFPHSFLASDLGAEAVRCIVQEVVGDSMSPTYQPGDRVIVDLSQTRLTTDTVYAISDGEAEPQIKRLQRVPFSDPPMVKIISDNPNLETFDAELSRVQIIGRIIGVVARR
jgi:transcriptional regulator with XRE-family HTH domain